MFLSNEVRTTSVVPSLYVRFHVQYRYKEVGESVPACTAVHQVFKKYRDVDFRAIRSFQPDWQEQTMLSLVHRDMTTACLIHFGMSLPALVGYIGVLALQHTATMRKYLRESNRPAASRIIGSWSESLRCVHQPTSTPSVRRITTVRTKSMVTIRVWRTIYQWSRRH